MLEAETKPLKQARTARTDIQNMKLHEKKQTKA